MKRSLVAAFVALTLAAPAAFAEVVEISVSREMDQRVLAPQTQSILRSSDVTLKMRTSVDGEAMIDLLDGKVAAAAIAGNLQEAVADARIAAFARNRVLSFPKTLAFHEVGRIAPNNVPYGFVTVGKPGEPLARVIAFMRSGPAESRIARRDN
jgi:hypothetical protein